MSTEPSVKGSPSSMLFAEGVLLAAASAVVYLATYLYEYGFCSYYEIPANLINPSLSTVLVAAVAIGGVFISSLKMLGLSAPLLRAARTSPNQGLRRLFAFSAVFLILGILLLVIYGFSLRGACWYLGLVALFFLITYFPVLFFDRKKPIQRRLEEYAADDGGDRLDLPVLVEEWFGRKWLGLFLLLIIPLGVAYLVGHGEATRKERFLVFKDAPDTVVLRAYGELLISAKFDPAKKMLGQEVVLTWLSEKKQISFMNLQLGHLSPPPKEPANASVASGSASAASTTQAASSALASSAPASVGP